jgi:uncharacterized protein (TIGR03067 family)
MKAFGLILVALGFLVEAKGLSQKEREDNEKIQGTWKIVSFEARGKKELLPPEALKVATVVITADKMTFDFGKEKLEARFKIDPAKKPKTIDLEELKEKNAKPVPGIYLLQGDSLKLCWDANGRSRPTEFTKEGKIPQDLRLVALKREKK